MFYIWILNLNKDDYNMHAYFAYTDHDGNMGPIDHAQHIGESGLLKEAHLDPYLFLWG